MEGSSKLNVKKARGGGDMRFNTRDVMELRATLSKAAMNKIKKLGFDDCLEISLFDLGCRDLIREVHSKCKVMRFNAQAYILFDMDPENPYYMTPETVGVILGAPKGMDSNTMPSTSNAAKLDELLHEVFDLGSNEHITTGHIFDATKFAQDCGDVDVEVKCFFLLLFNGLLMPHSSPYISSGVMGYAEDLESIVKETRIQ